MRPLAWPLWLALTALVLSLGLFAWVTDAPAYAGTKPETCNNCHVMDAAYENWFHAPHARWATCSDCHIPHENFLAYWFYKGKSGMRDVYSFVTASYPPLIRANEETKRIVQENCIRCHLDTVEGILTTAMPLDRPCWDCHRHVAHGARGLTMYPYQDSEVYGK
ncbi:MAG: cytochrome c nitrite reductase small subunit [Anaerolineales bacterium]|nr:cytochrome c nitrite reductase small subunit [Anaerolineales bacterium]MCX7607806.1 cytochrome c nitrite reductase small subunit [Anaerolineales bacterium]MDW8227131.1 cytochrome c nitrite reductase small subunit [Anaerolineales bacterium]